MSLGTGFEAKSREGNGEVNRHNVFQDGEYSFWMMTRENIQIKLALK